MSTEASPRSYCTAPPRLDTESLQHTLDFLVALTSLVTRHVAAALAGLPARSAPASFAAPRATAHGDALACLGALRLEGAAEFGARCAKRAGEDVRRVFGKGLMQLEGVSSTGAQGVVARFPTAMALFRALEDSEARGDGSGAMAIGALNRPANERLRALFSDGGVVRAPAPAAAGCSEGDGGRDVIVLP